MYNSRSMWTWSLNWGEITPRILVGTCPMTTADLDRIGAETGVSAVLSVQHDDCLAYWGIDYAEMRTHGEKLGLRMARSPMRDFDIPHQRRNLAQAVRELADLQSDGHRTYVHCTAGLGRAPLTVLSHLVWVEGLSPEEAISLIHRGRPGAVPAWEAHQGCRADLLERYRPRIEERAYMLSQARSGEGDAQSDWLQAEVEVLRSVLCAQTYIPTAPASAGC
jgi:hypothetical protein